MNMHTHAHAHSHTHTHSHAHTHTRTHTHTRLYKDHHKLFVGDARGSVFSWTVSDNLGEFTNSLPIFLTGIHLVYS